KHRVPCGRPQKLSIGWHLMFELVVTAFDQFLGRGCGITAQNWQSGIEVGAGRIKGVLAFDCLPSFGPPAGDSRVMRAVPGLLERSRDPAGAWSKLCVPGAFG